MTQLVSLKNLINRYLSGFLSTPNIQVLEKKLYDETIVFTPKESPNVALSFSTFKNSELIKMKFIKVGFVYSYFEKCLIQNCCFEDVIDQIEKFLKDLQSTISGKALKFFRKS